MSHQNHFPKKNQKAVQEKFYKAIKDKREPRWKKLYDNLRTQNDSIKACTGTVDNIVEIPDEDTVMRSPPENSSETLSETTMADENSVTSTQTTRGSILDGIENDVEDVKTTL